MGMISSMPPKESSSKDHLATGFGAIFDPSGANRFLSHVLGSLLWSLWAGLAISGISALSCPVQPVSSWDTVEERRQEIKV